MSDEVARVLRQAGAERVTLESAGVTLGAQLLALEVSSPCFCCGSELVAWSPASSSPPDFLTCPWCGAEVAFEEAGAAGDGSSSPALFIAA